MERIVILTVLEIGEMMIPQEAGPKTIQLDGLNQQNPSKNILKDRWGPAGGKTTTVLDLPHLANGP